MIRLTGKTEPGASACARSFASWVLSWHWATRLWLILAVVVSIKVCIRPHDHTLYELFYSGTQDWWGGRSLFEDTFYRYGPPFAVMMSPFALLPYTAGNILWNLFNLSVLYFSVVALARHALPWTWSARREGLLLAITLVAVIRPVWASQSHVLTAALLALSAVAVIKQRWWCSSFLLAGAVFIKLAPIAVALLLAAMWPRQLSWRLAIALLVVAVAPFLAGGPAYVWAQYDGWFDHLFSTHDFRFPSFRDAWMLWEMAGQTVHAPIYRIVQIAAGAGVLGWCLWQKRRLQSDAHLLTFTLAMGAAYMLVFGPAVEFVQYVIIGPFVGWALLECFGEKRDRIVVTICTVMMLVMGFGACERLLERITGWPYFPAACTMGTILFAAWLARHAHRTALQATCEQGVLAFPGSTIPLDEFRDAA